MNFTPSRRVVNIAFALAFIGAPAFANPFFDNNLLKTAPIEVFEMALTAGVSPASRSEFGMTTVQVASLTDRTELVDLLLKYGADINAVDTQDMTPLMQTIIQGTPKMVRHLIDAGADVNVVGYDGRNALDFAVKQPSALHVVPMLLAAGARQDVQNEDGLYPILSAARFNELGPQVIPLLLENGGSLDQKDPDGRNIAAVAITGYNRPVVEYLLRYSPETFGPDALAKPALHYVFEISWDTKRNTKKRIEMIELLLRVGMDINATDWAGTTALHIAAAGEETVLLDTLLKYGADPNIADRGGRLPLDYAKANSVLLGSPSFFLLEGKTNQ